MSGAIEQVSLDANPELILQLVDQLDGSEFSDVAVAIKERARRRAYDALKEMRRSARKAGLRKKDFEEAIAEVRAEKRRARAASTRRVR